MMFFFITFIILVAVGRNPFVAFLFASLFALFFAVHGFLS